MRFFLLLVFISLLFCFPVLAVADNQETGIDLSVEERTYLEAHETIIFVSQTNYPPFEFLDNDGMPEGMTIELIRWLATEIGFRTKFKNSSFSDAQKSVLAGDSDVLTSFFYSEDRDLYFDFSQPIFVVPASIFVPSDRPDIVQLSDLKGKRIAIPQGDYAKDFLEASGIDFTMIATLDFAAAADIMIAGNADAIVGDEQIILYHLYSRGLIDKVKKVGVPLYQGRDCFGLKNGNRVLQGILNKGINYARSNGVLDRLIVKWLGTKYPANDNYWALLWPFLVIASVTILLVVLWNLRLHRAVELKTRYLRESEQKLKTIFDHSYQFIGLLKPDGRLLDVNQTAIAFSGETKENLINRYFWDAAWWQNSSTSKDQLRAAIECAANGEIAQFETIHSSQEDSPLSYDVTITPVVDDRGVVTLLIPEARDISERKRVEQQLQESREHFRELIEQSPIGLSLSTKAGMYVQVNSAFAKIIGYSLDETLTLSYFDITPEKYALDDQLLLQQLETYGQYGPFEKEYRHKDGHLVPVRLNGMLVMREGEAYIWSSVEDITALKMAEAEKTELTDRLRQSQKMEAIGTLAGGVAHDFNNMLSAILGYTELTLRNPASNAKIKKNLTHVLTAAERAKELIKQILMFSRKGKLNPQLIDLPDIVGEAVQLLEQTIPATVSICADIHSDTGTVLADPTQIQQVVINLCTNAYHAIPEQGGKIHISLQPVTMNEISVLKYPELKSGRYGQLTVADNGFGMTPEIMANIFDPFFTTKKQGEGTGMGLAVVHGIVRNHEGAIDVESVPGQGTTFNVFFLLSTGEPEQKLSTTSTRNLKGTERILLIDDEDILVNLGKEILESLGYRVTATTSALEAVKLFQSNPDDYDLVITDQTMPEMAGHVLAQKVLSIKAGFPVIICTGHSAVLDAEKALAIGVKTLLMKPLNSAVLSSAVRKILD